MAQNLDPLPDQFRAKTAVVGVCSTFAFATKLTVEEVKNCCRKENTAKSTGFWLSFWKNKEITDEIENFEPAELNTVARAFLRRSKQYKQGEDYEPESLKVMTTMMASRDRHVRNKRCTLSIVRDREFSSSKEVLEDK